MTGKTVSYMMDQLPSLALKDLEKLIKHEDIPDDQIDFSDSMELTGDQLVKMKQGVHYRPIKKQITVRLDADVLSWLKIGGKGYQTRMNKILRHAMQTYTWKEIRELHSLENEE